MQLQVPAFLEHEGEAPHLLMGLPVVPFRDELFGMKVTGKRKRIGRHLTVAFLHSLISFLVMSVYSNNVASIRGSRDGPEPPEVRQVGILPFTSVP